MKKNLSFITIALPLLISFFTTHGTGETCTNEKIRITGGYDASEGRVDVCVNQSWSSVCPIGWDFKDAQVVCRQFGYQDTSVILAKRDIEFVRVDPTYGSVYCNGTEATITECNTTSTCNAGHSQDNAGVKCLPEIYKETFKCKNEGVIRLMGGRKPNEGRVEICVNGYWGVVCGEGWNDDDAQVVCRQLGYTFKVISGNTYATISDHNYGRGSGPLVYSNLQCVGNETHLANCSHDDITPVTCTSFDAAGITCENPTCTDGSIRLVGSSFNGTAGTVEVCRSGSWGTICDQGWDDNDAKVVCRQLGLQGGIATKLALHGQGSGFVVMDTVDCNGNEETIDKCNIPNSLLSCSNTQHQNDAGVKCYDTCIFGDVRLANGLTKYEGRVEYCNNNGVWVTVSSIGWNTPDAKVVCRQLGYVGGVSLPDAYYGRGRGIIGLIRVQCTGREQNLNECSKSTFGQDDLNFHLFDASAVCLPPCPCKDRALLTICHYIKGKGNEVPSICKRVL